MKTAIFYLILSITALAQSPARHPYTGRYVMTYSYAGKSQIDVFTIDPDGTFSFRDFGSGGRMTSLPDKEFAMNLSNGNQCVYRFLRLADRRKLRMDLVKGIPSVCPPSSELVTTEFQPHAPVAPSVKPASGHGSEVDEVFGGKATAR